MFEDQTFGKERVNSQTMDRKVVFMTRFRNSRWEHYLRQSSTEIKLRNQHPNDRT